MNRRRDSRKRWRLCPALTLGIAALLLVACQPGDDDSAAVSTDPYGVHVALSTNRITVGDLVELTIVARHPADTRVELPPFRQADPIEVRDRATQRRPMQQDRQESTFQFTLTSFELGSHVIATGTVSFAAADTEPVTRDLPGAVLDVVSAIDDEDAELQPIQPPLAWPDRIPRWIPVLFGVALLALIVGLLAKRWLQRRHTIIRHMPAPPAHETALNALRLLKSKGYIERGDVEPFYSECSDIVRRYLEDRFDLRAPESTTEEFIRDAASARVLSADQQALVAQFLEQSDLVKFARFRPGAPEMKDAVQAAQRLIEETRVTGAEEGAGT